MWNSFFPSISGFCMLCCWVLMLLALMLSPYNCPNPCAIHKLKWMKYLYFMYINMTRTRYPNNSPTHLQEMNARRITVYIIMNYVVKYQGRRCFYFLALICWKLHEQFINIEIEKRKKVEKKVKVSNLEAKTKNYKKQSNLFLHYRNSIYNLHYSQKNEALLIRNEYNMKARKTEIHSRHGNFISISIKICFYITRDTMKAQSVI